MYLGTLAKLAESGGHFPFLHCARVCAGICDEIYQPPDVCKAAYRPLSLGGRCYQEPLAGPGVVAELHLPFCELLTYCYRTARIRGMQGNTALSLYFEEFCQTLPGYLERQPPWLKTGRLFEL